MSSTVDVYSLSELREQFPDAFERVHNRWKECVARSGDIPWGDETMASLKAVINACGGTLRDWAIGPDVARCFLKVSVDDEWEVWEEDEQGDTRPVTHQKDAYWLFHEVLKPIGCSWSNVGQVRPTFPGDCVLTGYCADDAFLEAVYKALEQGDTLTEALAGLADVASHMMEENMEQAMSEEDMFCNWGDCQFTEDGIQV